MKINGTTYRELLLIKANSFVFFLTALALTFSACALAEDENRKEGGKKAQVLSMKVYKDMTRLQGEIQAGEYSSAEKIAHTILDKGKKLKPYDRAKTYEMLTSIHLGKEEYEQSVSYAKKALEQNILGQDSTVSMHHKLFYLYFYLENYDDSITHFDSWLALEPSPDIQSYFTGAQVYALAEKTDDALVLARKAMSELAMKGNIEPKESWYQLLISIQLRLKQYADASESLELAISRWPGRLDYYVQLSAVYQELGQEKESLAMLSMAYQYDLIKSESDIARLVQLYRYHAYPYRGAEIIASEIQKEAIQKNEKHWVLMSDALIQSRHWSEANTALLNAANLSSSGDHWFHLCQSSFQDEKWGDVQQYCTAALDSGGLDNDEGSAWYLLALSQYYEKRLTLASRSFEKCARWSKTQSDCTNWNVFLVQAMANQAQEIERLKVQNSQENHRKKQKQEEIDQAILMKAGYGS